MSDQAGPSRDRGNVLPLRVAGEGDEGSRMVARVVWHPTIAGLHAALRELARREAGQ